MELSEIQRKIHHCICNIYANDADLFRRNNYELTVSAKLSQYLFVKFQGYDVDCEYDKHIDTDKYSEELGREIRPDIVIHKRGTDEHNLVYIEIKKSQNTTDRAQDIEKVIAMTRVGSEYHYDFGLFIDFTPDIINTRIQFYIDGNEIM